MPKRNFSFYIPPEIKIELNQKIIDKGFTRYEQIEEWLNNRLRQYKQDNPDYDADIPDSVNDRSINTYAEKELRPIVEENYRFILLSQALVNHLGGKIEILEDANLILTQQLLFKQLLKISQKLDDDEEAPELAPLIKSMAALQRASNDKKKLRKELEAKFEKLEEEARHIDTEGKPIIDPNALKAIKEQVYGIFD